MDCDPPMPAAESVPPTAVTGDLSFLYINT